MAYPGKLNWQESLEVQNAVEEAGGSSRGMAVAGTWEGVADVAGSGLVVGLFEIAEAAKTELVEGIGTAGVANFELVPVSGPCLAELTEDCSVVYSIDRKEISNQQNPYQRNSKSSQDLDIRRKATEISTRVLRFQWSKIDLHPEFFITNTNFAPYSLKCHN